MHLIYCVCYVGMYVCMNLYMRLQYIRNNASEREELIVRMFVCTYVCSMISPIDCQTAVCMYVYDGLYTALHGV